MSLHAYWRLWVGLEMLWMDMIYVRMISAWQFYVIMLFASILFTIMAKRFYWDLPRARNSAKALALEVSKQKWYVQGASAFGRKNTACLDSEGWGMVTEYDGDKADNGSTELRLASFDSPRSSLTILIRPGHPSIQALLNLTLITVVEFNFVEKPLECARNTELCAWLVLKNLGH
jgi:hypothetical protein